jgi:hypothetical protein
MGGEAGWNCYSLSLMFTMEGVLQPISRDISDIRCQARHSFHAEPCSFSTKLHTMVHAYRTKVLSTTDSKREDDDHVLLHSDSSPSMDDQ